MIGSIKEIANLSKTRRLMKPIKRIVFVVEYALFFFLFVTNYTLYNITQYSTLSHSDGTFSMEKSGTFI